MPRVETDMTDSLSTQVGGTHYKVMAIQPIVLSMANRYDACIHSAIKYVSRWRTKGGVEDLKKAQHFCQLRVDSFGQFGIDELAAATKMIPIRRYILENGLSEAEGKIVAALHGWAAQRKSLNFDPEHNRHTANVICILIENLIQQERP